MFDSAPQQHRSLPSIATAVMLASFVGTAAAAPSDNTLSGQIDVSLQITSGCYITNGSGDNGNGSVDDDGNLVFGSLDFGAAPPVWSSPLQAQVQSDAGTGPITVMCSPDQDSFSVTIDGGLNGDDDQRYLVTGDNTTADQRVPYNLYRSDAYDTSYAPNTAVDIELDDGSNTAEIPIYGQIENNPTNPKQPGSYADTLTMTLTF